MYQESNFRKCKACLKAGSWKLYTSCGMRSAERLPTRSQRVHASYTIKLQQQNVMLTDTIRETPRFSDSWQMSD